MHSIDILGREVVALEYSIVPTGWFAKGTERLRSRGRGWCQSSSPCRSGWALLGALGSLARCIPTAYLNMQTPQKVARLALILRHNILPSTRSPTSNLLYRQWCCPLLRPTIQRAKPLFPTICLSPPALGRHWTRPSSPHSKSVPADGCTSVIALTSKHPYYTHGVPSRLLTAMHHYGFQ